MKLKALLNIDRRIIYLIMLLSVIIPLVAKLDLPTKVTSEVESIFNAIEALQGTGKAVLISIDYDPSTAPELHPMSKAVMRHAMLRRIPVLGITLLPQGIGMGVDALGTTAREYGAKSLEDYVFLGFQTPPLSVMLGLGEDIRRVFPETYDKVPTDTIPLLERIKNYDDIGLTISISGTSIPMSWVATAGTRFNQPVAAGVTAVSAADLYPFLQTNQLVGMMGGVKGGAEYEELLDRLEARLGTAEQRFAAMTAEDAAMYKTDRYMARQIMNPQSIAHLTIIAFVLLGNVGYLLTERGRKRG